MICTVCLPHAQSRCLRSTPSLYVNNATAILYAHYFSGSPYTAIPVGLCVFCSPT